MSDEQGFTVGEIVGALQRRRRIVVLSAVIGVVAAFGAVTVLGGSYMARAQVNVEKISGNDFSSGLPLGDEINMASERNTARSDAVVLAVIENLDLPESRDDLLEIGIVSINSSSFSTTIDPTLTFEVEHSNADKAAAIANEWAAEYLRHRTAIAEERIDEIISGNNSEIERLQEEATAAFVASADAARATAESLPALARELAAQFPGISASDALTIAESSIGVSEAEAEANAELSALSVTPGTQTRVASAPQSTTGLGGILAGVATFGFVLTVGCLLALVVDRLDPRVRDDDELAERMGAAHHHTAAPGDPRSRALLAGVAVRAANSEFSTPRRLLIASIAGPPPFQNARDLVAELEVAGERCLVLTTDGGGQLRLDGPRVRLEEVLGNDEALDDVLDQAPDGRSLWLTAGSTATLRTALAPESMKDLRRIASRHHFAMICVVAGSPADDSAISQLTNAVDRTVFFATDRPSRAEVEAAHEALASLDIDVDELVTT